MSLVDLNNPTPLPASCKTAEGYTFVNPFKGYCFSYPQDFLIQAFEFERPLFLGPVVDENLEPAQVSFWIETEPAENADMASAVETFINAQPVSDPAIERTTTSLAGIPAEILDNVPGQLASRVVITVQNGVIYRLWFNPADENRPELQTDLERAFTAVTGSFGWLPK